MRRALLALTLAGTALSAQRSPDSTVSRRGIITSGGAGLAWLTLPCSSCEDIGIVPMVGARMGYGLAERWAVVSDVGFGFGDKARVGGVFISSLHRLSTPAGLYARAGAGVLFGLRPSTAAQPHQLRSPAASAGIGFDRLIGEVTIAEVSLDWAGAIADGTVNHPATNPLRPESRPSVLALTLRLQQAVAKR